MRILMPSCKSRDKSIAKCICGLYHRKGVVVSFLENTCSPAALIGSRCADRSRDRGTLWVRSDSPRTGDCRTCTGACYPDSASHEDHQRPVFPAVLPLPGTGPAPLLRRRAHASPTRRHLHPCGGG